MTNSRRTTRGPV